METEAGATVFTCVSLILNSKLYKYIHTLAIFFHFQNAVQNKIKIQGQPDCRSTLPPCDSKLSGLGIQYCSLFKSPGVQSQSFSQAAYTSSNFWTQDAHIRNDS